MMARYLPIIRCRQNLGQAFLSLWDKTKRQAFEIALDSPDWFEWLKQEQSFRFVYYSSQVSELNLTIRPEKRGQRTYWQAWKTMRGQTTKKYLGPTPKLTRAKLEQAAEWFAKLPQFKPEIDPSMRFYAAAVDLIWLVEQLCQYCSEPALCHKAQQEVSRIKRVIGN